MNRRHCIGFLAGGGAAFAWPALAVAAPATANLAFSHTHTGERLNVTYRRGGSYVQDSLDRIASFLRDFRTGDVHPIDPSLLDQLAALRLRTGTDRAFHVISGYRSPKTNAMLSKRGGGIAKKSFHMRGRAIDVRMPGFDTRGLRNLAVKLEQGGVGFYARSDFIHLDTGRARSW